ncbi:glycosyltransferase family 4 protein [Thermoanaerobacterium sp. CMT5567-10]|uniref:glycosyltransferase family 4 protein n=1 Tax=Thermoanaerobacterium sp. CMT5567-10 TaxID=3061989 RepID=UPI0026DEF55A|nr:glycosyltransferase family 4 protein [Thermoanaerobacterium sp. CMT5567-10]WKV08817.1 glycosyltransferase family 4 protein [Thermoanaerobacterium sp. CMT5567-10]
MGKIKVMHIIRAAEGGMKKHLLSILLGLDKEKYQLAVGCSFDKNTSDYLRKNGVLVYHVDICDGLNVSKDANAIIRIRNMIKDFKPEIVHFHGAKASLVGRLACLGCNSKVVMTVHNFPEYRRMNKIKKRLYLGMNKCLNKRTNAIITVSEALKKAIVDEENIDPEKVNVIYNCVDLSTYQDNPFLDLRKEYNLESDTLLIGCISRLIPSKGVQDLIKALEILKGRVKVFAFVAGDGPYLNYLQDMAKEAKLENIQFLGYRNDIKDFLRNIDIFVLPSHSEGFGVSVAEAMALGVPVIATNVGGIPEIIKNNEDGIIVNPESPNDLANAIEILATNADLRNKFSKKGREYIVNNFSKEKMLNKIDTLYENLRRK